jgi:hypothetical protein
MLTKKQNFLETIHGGQPDRFVNQYEPFALTFGIDPLSVKGPAIKPGVNWVTPWGITMEFAEGSPGPMPLHDNEHIVLKDITGWRDVLQAPSLEFTEEHWQPIQTFAAQVDRNEQYLTLVMLPGLMEQLHHLMGMQNAMMAIALEPEQVSAFLDYYVNWEIAYARLLIDRIHPDALFHHDDWGSANSTLISPAMFAGIFVPAYKKLYGFYKDNGVEIIVHHSDSYAATLVPAMIELGIDVWQGVMSTNNTPELIKQYGGQISFMGDIDNRVVDVENWTEELIHSEVLRACQRCGKLYFIPNTIQGDPTSVYPGVYEAVSREIDKASRELF